MSDYKFVFTKTIEVVIEAANENDAWMRIAQIDPETLGATWEIHDQSSAAKAEIPLDQGPVEIDDWGSDQF
jgi:hypothetical protein